MSGSAGFECVDVRNKLDSCGGCVVLGDEVQTNGRDCSAIEHADAVRCSHGRCVVDKCLGPYEVSPTQDSCVLDS